MNAIDQYVAPAPPRPAPQPAQSSRSGADTSGSATFGDVYNKAANANQSDSDPTDPHETAGDARQAKVEAKATAADEKSPTQSEVKASTGSSAGAAILALAADVKGKKATAADDQAAGTKTSENQGAADAKQELKNKLAADTAKLADKNGTTQDDAQTGATTTDAAAIALKLLGAEAVTKGSDKKVEAEDVGKKDEPAKEKAADAKADATGAATDTANTMAAAALVVSTGGGQAKDQQEQGKPKSEDLQSKTLATVGAKTSTALDDASKTTSSGDAVKPEAVTVLDARRFVGSGEVLSSNTQAVISGVTSNSDWSAAMKAASAASATTAEPRTGTPVNTLKIQMTPESLGNVTATLRLHGDQLTVHLSVESGEAFKQLSQDKEGLIQSLKSQGYSVDQVNVQLAPAAVADKTVAQTSSGQQTGGQMQDGSSAGQFAQQGREQDNNRRQQDNGFNATWQGDDKSVAVDPVNQPSDTARSGQVYL
ncbi:MAG TPA: flagellar hook-length control protein FliK [Ensifer sp.]|nr:flagellar hook-length control protein FliK [Ensifer sp.]